MFFARIRKIRRLFFIIIIIVTFKVTLSNPWKPLELTVCYGKLSKYATSTNDTSVIDVIEGSSVHLWCHFCNTKEDYNPKLWFYRPREMIKQTMKEIESRDDVINKNVSISLTHILSLSYFRPNYSGVYTCKRHENGHESTLTYLLEGVMFVEVNPKVGAYNQWREYRRMYMDPVNKKFKVSQEEPFKSFRKKYNTTLKVYTVWDNWSECEAIDAHQKGKRKRLGKCRICPVNNTVKNTHKVLLKNVVNSYLADAYDVPCRSIKLNEELPEISRIIRNIPEFEAEEICSVPRKTGLNKRCNRCRSRGDSGTCKDPFPLNVTEADAEVGLHIVACPSGWCGKLIEGTVGAFRQDDYGTATERMCLQRPPSDYEERCAYTMWNRKKVYMCFCNGDLCNAASVVSPFPLILILAVLCPIYKYLI